MNFTPKGIEETILAGMARAIAVSAYANASDEGELPEGSPKPGPGQDWMDYAPETPVRALLVARRWADRIIREPGNCCFTLWQLASRARVADFPETPTDTIDAIPTDYAESFGRNLAMQMMGHGVSWFDDHAEFPLVVPHAECPQWDELTD